MWTAPSFLCLTETGLRLRLLHDVATCCTCELSQAAPGYNGANDGLAAAEGYTHLCGTCRAPAKVAQLNGNSSALFKQRITRVQLTALCEALNDDDSIEYLDLSYNDATPACSHGEQQASTFGDEGADIVARMLGANSCVKYVLLESNAIGHEGAAALADALAGYGGGGGGVEVLNIAHNPIGNEVCPACSSLFVQT